MAARVGVGLDDVAGDDHDLGRSDGSDRSPPATDVDPRDELGDPAAFPEQGRASPTRAAGRLAEVYAAYWPHTVRFIARRVRPADRDLVEDLAQTTFLRAWPYLNRARVTDADDDGAMYRWLSTIARHVVCDHYRKGPARQRAAETPVAPDSPLWASARADHTTTAAGAAAVPDEAAAVEQRVVLAAAMEQLPADTRQILRLRVLDDVAINDVASQLGRGRATVVRHTAVGLAALRAQLTEQDRAVRRAAKHQRSPRRPPVGVSLSEYLRGLDAWPTPGVLPADRAGFDSTAAAMTLRDYGGMRLAPAMRGLADTTAEPYLAGWRQRVLPTLGHLPVGSIDAAAVDRAVRCWVADECGRSTVKNSRAVLARVLDQAVRDGILQRNPAKQLSPRPTAVASIDPAASTDADTTTPDRAERDQPGDTVDDDVATLMDQPQPVDADAGLTDSVRVEPTDSPGSVTLDRGQNGHSHAARAARADFDGLDDLYPTDGAHQVTVPDQRTVRRQRTDPAWSAGPDRADTAPPPPPAPAAAVALQSASVDQLETADPTISARVLNHQLAPGVEHTEAAEDDQAPRATQDRAAVAETAEAVEQARRALARMRQDRAFAQEQAADAVRAEQLARWHADAHPTDQADQVGGRYRELEGITR